jgi:hypothetical protein
LQNPRKAVYLEIGVIDMEATQTQPAYPRGLDFEQVWAAIERTDAIVKENARQIKETDRQIQETDRQIQEYNKRFGEFHRRFGEVVEYMVAPNLLKKFREYGFKFHEAMSDRVFSDDDDNTLFEVDVFLENSEKAMLVEVKTKLTTEYVKDHVKRLEKMRKYADLRGDKRIFLGAVAGVVMTPHVKKYALGHGFYVIEPSGETFNITPPSGQPKEW